MSRRTNAAAEAAARAASDAARTLQERGQQVKAERSEPAPEAPIADAPKAEPKADKEDGLISSERIQELRKGNPRLKVMEELERKGLERMGIKEEPEAPKEAPKAEAPKAEEQKAQPAEPVAAATETAAAESPATEAPKTVRVKVDGEEFDAPVDEVESYGGVKAYRIAKAQENRLKKTNEAVAESKRLTAQLVELLQQKQAPAQPKVTDDEFIKSKVDVIRFGTPDESAAALKEILQRSAPKQVDQNTLVGITLQAVQKQQAVADFRKEFPDVMANPLLLRLAASLEADEIASAQKNNQPIDYRNLYSKIGNQVRSVVPRQSQPTATQQTTGTPSQAPSEKEARKASITVLPAASARAELPKEEKEPTREEVILEMKKKRGQLG